jgi:hypothetical protein
VLAVLVVVAMAQIILPLVKMELQTLVEVLEEVAHTME